jgi:hypothetical protein
MDPDTRGYSKGSYPSVTSANFVSSDFDFDFVPPRLRVSVVNIVLFAAFWLWRHPSSDEDRPRMNANPTHS